MAASHTAPKQVALTSGPWRGVRNAADEPQVAGEYLYHAANCYFPDPNVAASVEIRPPWIEVEPGGILGGGGGLTLETEAGLDLITEAGDTLIGDGGRVGQCIYEHVRLDGTIDRYVFVNGRMYEWDGNNTSPTFTDVTPLTGVTIAATGRIYCETFANVLVVTDGVNRPWTYDPATSTATVIPYDTANSVWYAYGPPVIYDSALVFIVGAVAGVAMRGTFVWSETNLPLVGYQQDNYDNAWTLAQTDANPLTCLVATNTALYYFRAFSIGLVTGTIGSSFQTTAVQDGVSQVTGTSVPASVLVAGGYIWFLDYSGDPYRFRIGSTTLENLGPQVRDLIRYQLTLGLQGTQIAAGFSSYQPDLGLVIMASYAGFNVNTVASSVMAFDAETGAYQGQWDCEGVFGGLPLYTMGAMRDSNGNPSLCLLSDDAVIAAAATGGAFFRMRNISEMQSGAISYGDPSGTLCGVITNQMGGKDVGQWTFERQIVRSRSTTNAGTGVTLSTITPNGSSATSTVALSDPTPIRIALVPPAIDAYGMATGVTGLQGVAGRWAQVTMQPTTTLVTDLPFAPISITTMATESDRADPNVN